MDKLIIGCGYLGARVAERWRGAGQRVFTTTRSAERAATLHARGFEPIVCNVLDAESLRTLPSVDTVLYCVGMDRAAGVSMRDVYVGGLSNVLAALPPPRRFIYISSTGVYGQADGEMVDEDSATEPREESGRIVLEAERLLRSRVPSAIVLRFAGIYGPGRLMRLQALRAGEPIVGDADKWLNLIHVDDGVEVVLRAATASDRTDQSDSTSPEASRPRLALATYNVCDDTPVRRRDFYTTLARLAGGPAARFVPPAPGAPPPPHELANRRVQNTRLRRDLGIALRHPSYESGLSASLADDTRALSP